MKTKSHISTSIVYLLLTVMLYMHLCSALCATGAGGCCDKADNDNFKKSCCSDDNKSDEKDHDCQALHLSFFNTTGQFQSEKSDSAVKVFPNLIAVFTPLLNILLVSQNEDVFAYNGFHPPPPKANIRIFIQCFQI